MTPPQRSSAHTCFGALLLSVGLFGCTSAAAGGVEHGQASVYDDKYHGRRTASGRTFRQDRLTAAHRSLPFGAKVTVVAPTTGRSVVVEITDRGPFVQGRVIDLSRRAADTIGMGDLAQIVLVTD